MFHKPVLLEESIEYLLQDDDGWYVDLTMGGGGHSGRILEMTENSQVLAFDQDPDSWQHAPDSERLKLIPSNFRHLKPWISYLGIGKVKGVLVDLGVSSYQIDEEERGFSYQGEAELDMRMDKRKEFDAQALLNNYSVDELQNVLSEYGEVRNARTLASSIIEARRYGGIQTVSDLLAVLESHIVGKKNRYYSQVFQALRIEVNEEMESLSQMLLQLPEVMDEKARAVVISYHSLEDRLVKNVFKTGNVDGNKEKDKYGKVKKPFKSISKKVITPTDKEIKSNPRARSAKMRVAEKE